MTEDSSFAFINAVWAVAVSAVVITGSVLLFQGITASDQLNADLKSKCISAGGNYVLVEDGSIYACKLYTEKES